MHTGNPSKKCTGTTEVQNITTLPVRGNVLHLYRWLGKCVNLDYASYDQKKKQQLTREQLENISLVWQGH